MNIAKRRMIQLSRRLDRLEFDRLWGDTESDRREALADAYEKGGRFNDIFKLRRLFGVLPYFNENGIKIWEEEEEDESEESPAKRFRNN